MPVERDSSLKSSDYSTRYGGFNFFLHTQN
nr:MAG TPA: hypothetical protein [Caudoviricetes sp.]